MPSVLPWLSRADRDCFVEGRLWSTKEELEAESVGFRLVLISACNIRPQWVSAHGPQFGGKQKVQLTCRALGESFRAMYPFLKLVPCEAQSSCEDETRAESDLMSANVIFQPSVKTRFLTRVGALLPDELRS